MKYKNGKKYLKIIQILAQRNLYTVCATLQDFRNIKYDDQFFRPQIEAGNPEYIKEKINKLKEGGIFLEKDGENFYSIPMITLDLNNNQILDVNKLQENAGESLYKYRTDADQTITQQQVTDFLREYIIVDDSDLKNLSEDSQEKSENSFDNYDSTVDRKPPEKQTTDSLEEYIIVADPDLKNQKKFYIAIAVLIVILCVCFLVWIKYEGKTTKSSES